MPNEILIIIFLVGFALILFIINKKFKELQKPQNDDKSMLLMNQQMNELARLMDSRMDQSQRTIQAQFAQSANIIRDVTEKLSNLENTNKQVMGFANQLQSLENILKNPKQRGILGEYFLETLLKNVFQPRQYEIQYKFKDGEIVDAVIFVKDKIIPIDSKFSLENYNRIVEEIDPTQRERLEKQFKQDLKNRIDETAKYIRPKEGTMDFAFMFIPSEGIYYDLLVNQVGAVKVNTRDLLEYAFKEKHVIIVSPTSFYAYLQTVLQGLRAMQMEESIQDIVKRIGDLHKHLNSYEDYMKKMGKNLGTTVNMYNSAYKEFKKIDKDVAKIDGTKPKIEPLEIEKPREE